MKVKKKCLLKVLKFQKTRYKNILNPDIFNLKYKNHLVNIAKLNFQNDNYNFKKFCLSNSSFLNDLSTKHI